MEENKKKKITIAIIIGVVLFLVISAVIFVILAGALIFMVFNYADSYEGDYYRIEVGATEKNFSGKYRALFNVMDKDSSGELSHSEIMDFYNNTVVTKKDYADIFMLEDGKWTVSEGLKDAALEYYTQGKIVTPELYKKYGIYFSGINSGVESK